MAEGPEDFKAIHVATRGEVRGQETGMKKAFQSVQNRGLKPTDTRPSESSLPPLVSTAALGEVGAFLRKVMPAMWKKESETAQPEVVPVGTRDDSKSWTTIDGVITGLTRESRDHEGTVFSPLAVVTTVLVLNCFL